MNDVYTFKYIKLMGIIAAARVRKDWPTLLDARYKLYEVCEQLGLKS